MKGRRDGGRRSREGREGGRWVRRKRGKNGNERMAGKKKVEGEKRKG